MVTEQRTQSHRPHRVPKLSEWCTLSWLSVTCAAMGRDRRRGSVTRATVSQPRPVGVKARDELFEFCRISCADWPSEHTKDRCDLRYEHPTDSGTSGTPCPHLFRYTLCV